jgi:FtsZ-binding cell division protein ZapB
VDNAKAIAYQNFNVIAIKAIQEQQQEIEALKVQNKALMAQMGKMQAAIEALQQKR